MHELSLAQSLLDQILSLAQQHNARLVNKVYVTIGPFSGIVVNSFTFGFNALKLDHTATKSTELIVENPAAQYLCLECGKITTPTKMTDDHIATLMPQPDDGTCSHCGHKSLSPQGGAELILKQLEME